ncbi:mitochondrial F1F0-ATP synthase g subunit [Venturia nashicola]|uniref:Mitochondrial F1F0-ATP synthase g subunit n=1 Tax=Venturia nashicola TaxID=86259 RepID=A0A4Z1PBD3_9PEZI|nr:mitochondrial F1F0-ATP synthase g subunit [Venturia nashicola]TLD38620.1 mitochondrial F1F0-ATP synthase g subunit [Venturia nashicola]
MSLCISRAVRRQAQLVRPRTALRNASTTNEAANNAKAKTSEAASKASEGLSKVTSSAGSAITKVGSSVGNVLGGIGGRTGRLITFVSSMIPSTIYYSKVGLELAKIVAKEQKMSPPSADVFTKYLSVLRQPQTLLHGTTSSNPAQLLARVRNASNKEYAAVGIIAAEVIGFFSVGEMLGRLKIVGYRGNPHAEH